MLEDLSARGGSAYDGKRPNFFFWYYNQGVHELLEIWKNFLFFVCRFFSLREMLGTLFLPWRKDISVQTWRGFHPGKTLELIVGNLLSRVIGAVVRLFVFLMGTMTLLMVLIFGLIYSFLWVSFPFLFLLLIVLILRGTVDQTSSLSFITFWIVSSILYYFHSIQRSMLLLEFSELKKHAVFDRICARLGLVSKEIIQNALKNEQLLIGFLKKSGDDN